MDQIHFFNRTSSALFPVINLVLFSFLFLTRKALAVDENFTICSESKYCGKLQIKFPFSIQELEENRCGFPGYNISCRNNTHPILRLPDAEYVIHDIFYGNQSFHVSKVVSLDKDSVCDQSIIRNMSFPEDRFYLPADQMEIFLLFNCNLTLQPTWKLAQYKVNCSAETQTNATLALFKDDPQLNTASTYCTNTVVAPVAFPQEKGGVENMINRGFLLNWIASDCSNCENSRGKCGFDYGTYHFKCFCPDRPHASDCDPENNKLNLKLGLGIGCPLALMILIIIFAVMCRFKKKYANFLKGNTTSNLSSKSDLECSSDVYFGLPIFKYGELVEATNNFDREKELGDGGFGIVYHGKLRDGRDVAIKRLYQQNYRRLQQFMNEVEILTRLRHKNLVSLYGCTSSRSQELLLVYEFISNGTVADHLHGDLAQSDSLTWPIRMSIAIETATALSYLHASGIIHRDVKTNNILLDDKFSVKVADFGLSRLFPSDVTHVSTAPQGTPGYVDPEYHKCYQLTEKSDVYSFGVVLIELISSMPAVDISRHRHEINLANLAISKIMKCAFDELIDPTLGHKSDEEITRMATAVAELAFRCLQEEREMRPSMDDVLEELQRIQRGDYKLDNVHDQEEEQIDTDTVQGNVPPPSPQTGDQIALLKNNRMPPSPISVTDKWISRDTTPNTSG